MGSGQSVLLARELEKSVSCRDLTSEKEVMCEVKRLRKMIHDNRKYLVEAVQKPESAHCCDSPDDTLDNKCGIVLRNSDDGAICKRSPSSNSDEHSVQVTPMKTTPTGGASSPSRTNPANFYKFDNHQAKAFELDKAPELWSYLSKEFHRFQNSEDDQRLSWDSFWRFARYLDLNLSDDNIAALRQKADVNQDGFVDWLEMVDVFTPLLGKYWQAKIAHSPEYKQWEQLHWETQRITKRTVDGYTRCEGTFWINSVTGESSWTLPQALQKHPSFTFAIQTKKERNQDRAPSLEHYIRAIFSHHSSSSGDEKSKLEKVLFLGLEDGLIGMDEYLAVMFPLLKQALTSRGGPEWIALETIYDGQKYLYWFNRISGEASWFPPQKKLAGKNTVSAAAVKRKSNA